MYAQQSMQGLYNTFCFYILDSEIIAFFDQDLHVRRQAIPTGCPRKSVF